MPRPLPITSPTPAQPVPTTSPSTSTPATNRPPFRYQRTDPLPKKQPEVWPLNEKIDEKAGNSSVDSHEDFAHRNHTPGTSHSRTKSRQQSINALSASHSSRHFPPPLSRPLIPPHHRHQRSISRPPFTPMHPPSSGCSILPPSLRPWGPLLAWAATTLGFLIAIAFWRSELFSSLDNLSTWLREQDNEGYAILGFMIFLTTIPPLPLYSTLIILAGYTYGAVSAFVISYLASLFGAFFVFQFSRVYLRAGTATHAFPQSLRRVVRAIEKKPSLLFLIRLAPYPYNVLSYLLGAGSNINIGQYMTCTAVSLFKIIVHTTIGSEIHNFANYHVQPQDGDNAETTQGNAMGRYWTIFGIILCVVLFVYLWVVARRAVDELDDSRDNCLTQRHGPLHPSSPHPRRQEYAPFLSNEEAYSYDVEANVLFDSGMVESPFKPRGVVWDHQSQLSSPDHLYTDHFELALSERGQSSSR